MAVDTYLVHLLDEHQDNDASRGDVAALIAQLGGFMLMATSAGSLIAASDEQHLGHVRAHHAVAFCGGVTLNPKGPAADRLRAMFARNVAAQLTTRQTARSSPTSQARPEFPPGYRPLRWRDRFAS
jgi:hypothetical protein